MNIRFGTLLTPILLMACTALVAAGTEAPATGVVYPVEVDLGALVTAVDSGGDTQPSPAPGIPRGATSLTQLVHFDSIDSNECCGGGATVVPPDPDIAAGPDHLVVAINLSLEIYNKSGASLVGPVELTTFFAPVGGPCASNPFFPVVLYDEDADRFFVTADGNGEIFCAAVSQTADPTGAWWVYPFIVGVGEFFDWPQVGIGRDALYVGASMFGIGTGRVFAMDKAAMYAGLATATVTRDLGGYGRPQPLHLHGVASGTWPQSGPHYFLSLTDPPDPGAFTLHIWNDPFGADVFVTIGDLDVAAAHGVPVVDAIPFPQAGGSPIDGRPDLFKDFEYDNGSGWTTSHVACNPGGGLVDCVQWAEIELDSGTVSQAGVFASSGVFRTYPDLAVNACGDMVVGYTRSSATTFPSIGAAGRRAVDPPGTLQDELIVKDGEIPYTAFAYRWGEYMGMTPDPDGERFWYVGEYSKNNGNLSANYGNYVSSFAFPPCSEIFADGFESGDTTRWSVTVP